MVCEAGAHHTPNDITRSVTSRASNDVKVTGPENLTGDRLKISIEVLQGARLSLNGFSHHRFSQDSLAFSAILRVNGIGRSMAKTIVTIAI